MCKLIAIIIKTKIQIQEKHSQNRNNLIGHQVFKIKVQIDLRILKKKTYKTY